MCLDNVTWRDPSPHGNITEGWKVFHTYPQLAGKLYAEYYSWGHAAAVEDVWQEANYSVIGASRPSQSYPTGFHFFLFRDDAEAYKKFWYFDSHQTIRLRKVQLRCVHTVGEQLLDCKRPPLKVGVARFMRIMPAEVKG